MSSLLAISRRTMSDRIVSGRSTSPRCMSVMASPFDQMRVVHRSPPRCVARGSTPYGTDVWITAALQSCEAGRLRDTCPPSDPSSGHKQVLRRSTRKRLRERRSPPPQLVRHGVVTSGGGDQNQTRADGLGPVQTGCLTACSAPPSMTFSKASGVSNHCWRVKPRSTGLCWLRTALSWFRLYSNTRR